MSKKRFHDVLDTLEFGLDTQHDLASLNRVVSKIVKERDLDRVMALFDEILAVSGEDQGELISFEKRMEEIEGELTRERIELLKEEKLLESLRMTNDAYIVRLDENIKEVEGYVKTQQFSFRELAGSKRVTELETTKAVAASFSEQIKLSEDSLKAMADRIGEVQSNVLPLLRGRISLHTSSSTFSDAQRLLREKVEDMKNLTKN